MEAMEKGYLIVTTLTPPGSKVLLDDSHFPFACILKPFVPNEEIPKVTFPTKEIIRCSQCKGYINPFCEFLEAGRK